ncbi:peptide deformylase [Candidatus Parcubacteria bacterium]|nr:MAG: peptide deformylase [Candidatus Parcubacteria bacterium]
MAIRDILQIGDPKLKAKNKAVKNLYSPRIKRVIKDIIDTMHKNDLVGIAAPQIGENYRLIVTEPRKTKTRKADQADELRAYINPQIVNFSNEEVVIYEGCGSVAYGELFGPVRRPKQITIEAYDLDGTKFRLVCDGLLGRVIQHEYDHLSGIEFTEKILDYKQLMSWDFYVKEISSSPLQTEASKITVKQFSKIF